VDIDENRWPSDAEDGQNQAAALWGIRKVLVRIRIKPCAKWRIPRCALQIGE
jgi:hypothetical protein